MDYGLWVKSMAAVVKVFKALSTSNLYIKVYISSLNDDLFHLVGYQLCHIMS